MRILHSADWHLDAPLGGYNETDAAFLREQLRLVPQKIADLCKSKECDLLLLSGDLFDGKYTKESYRAVYAALEEVNIPVFIAPGNHDFCKADSPYLMERWPENVHIFTRAAISSYALPQLDARIYGAGFESMDCPGLLKDFATQGDEKWQIGVLHGDPTVASSPYCPITHKQVKESGLSYLALGHIHKEGSFHAGDTLCAWPGCPMGKAMDEDGIKGALLVTLDEKVTTAFIPLDTPRFFDIEVDAGNDPSAAAAAILPSAPCNDFYRITFTGYADPFAPETIAADFSHVPHLVLRDRTMPETDLWGSADDDTLEGVYFRLLREALDTDSAVHQQRVRLAAKISRQILDGQEVKLP